MPNRATWFKRAQEAPEEQAQPQQGQSPVTPQQPAGQDQAKNVPQANQAPQTVEPKPSDQQKRQQNGPETTLAAVQAIAQQSLPYLNQTLGSIKNAVMSVPAINAGEDSARILAVEIMAAWLSSTANGDVTDMASVISKSPRILTMVSMAT